MDLIQHGYILTKQNKIERTYESELTTIMFSEYLAKV